MTTTTPPSAETPLGIDVLEPLERVSIRERTAEFPNDKYVVVADGAALLTAREQAGEGVVGRVLAGRSRAFQIDVFDTQHREVMKLRRPYAVGGDKMEVWLCGAQAAGAPAGPAGPAAVVRREVTFFKPVLIIYDSADRPVVRVKGPVSTSGQCYFELFSAEKERIGAIGKCWSGASRARAGDCFTAHFPRELAARYKAAVIATCFFIDFLIFDN